MYSCLGVCSEYGKSYAVYMITVTKQNPKSEEQSWDVYRRYSDFHDLHAIIQDKVCLLSCKNLLFFKTMIIDDDEL